MPRSAFLKHVLLLGYLALFLNLGPSLHRAPIFGLHNHSSVATSCACGHHHGPTKESGHGDIQKTACDDCALCRFFNHYNVTVDVDDEFLFVERSSIYPDPREPQSFVAAIPKTARGPPAA